MLVYSAASYHTHLLYIYIHILVWSIPLPPIPTPPDPPTQCVWELANSWWWVYGLYWEALMTQNYIDPDVEDPPACLEWGERRGSHIQYIHTSLPPPPPPPLPLSPPVGPPADHLSPGVSATTTNTLSGWHRFSSAGQAISVDYFCACVDHRGTGFLPRCDIHAPVLSPSTPSLRHHQPGKSRPTWPSHLRLLFRIFFTS